MSVDHSWSLRAMTGPLQLRVMKCCIDTHVVLLVVSQRGCIAQQLVDNADLHWGNQQNRSWAFTTTLTSDENIHNSMLFGDRLHGLYNSGHRQWVQEEVQIVVQQQWLKTFAVSSSTSRSLRSTSCPRCSLHVPSKGVTMAKCNNQPQSQQEISSSVRSS